MYRVENARRQVERQITALPAAARGRVTSAIRALASEPRPAGVRKLSGELEGLWRVRVGDYRIIYRIDDEHQLVIITGVYHRRDAYR